MGGIQHLALDGGHPALDFVNTVEDRLGHSPDEYLKTPYDLAHWGHRLGILGTVRDRLTAAELTQALTFREHLAGLLAAHVAGQPSDPSDLQALADAVVTAHRVGKLTESEHGRLVWQWDPEKLDTVRHAIAASAFDLLGGPVTDRIGVCAGLGCGWFFLDTSKRGNRRWCSMRECGQQAKNERRRGAASAH